MWFYKRVPPAPQLEQLLSPANYNENDHNDGGDYNDDDCNADTNMIISMMTMIMGLWRGHDYTLQFFRRWRLVKGMWVTSVSNLRAATRVAWNFSLVACVALLLQHKS